MNGSLFVNMHMAIVLSGASKLSLVVVKSNEGKYFKCKARKVDTNAWLIFVNGCKIVPNRKLWSKASKISASEMCF
jgi:hypothetical protein